MSSQLLDKFNSLIPNTLLETLNMRFTFVDAEKGIVKIEMPVNSKVHQPMGLLHGGASAALAETLGSASSLLYVDPNKYNVLGIEISCNHLRAKRDGVVTGTARILHKGRTTHLWEIQIRDEEERLISQCKLTNLIVPVKD